jgi:hypothetical protein
VLGRSGRLRRVEQIGQRREWSQLIIERTGGSFSFDRAVIAGVRAIAEI